MERSLPKGLKEGLNNEGKSKKDGWGTKTLMERQTGKEIIQINLYQEESRTSGFVVISFPSDLGTIPAELQSLTILNC